ncbi:glutamate--cysteine ligase [Catenovulum sp. 2E275]|uniref:glutamate--cysteine ligase n=1 Tax=Catenovulum sp. 2E275 TaxID=2980497 RepID=UPI0021D0A72C|nr:glutamate--cysteine ligase [Catenovulum sp. 2E275]MCU4675005.1 glutamate--cysteine ligase [Catenovulum sp. 2E275]
MNVNTNLFNFLKSQPAAYFSQFSRGIEKEALRIQASGKLAKTSHPKGLGSALTHEFITTDYAESLLEFITPVEQSVEKSVRQLLDLHKFAYQKQGDELLWPMSMPCFVGCEDDIEIAKYGCSNIGKMKTLYRQGLKNRYGSYMQAISGVHFNFSFPESFWQAWAESHNTEFNQAAISAGYLALLRNLKRNLWLLAYLFGASPALCSSFLNGKPTKYPMQKVGKGTLYLPYATALRLSDLGYTNKAQAALNIRYNCLHDYIAGLRRAIKMPSADFAHIPAGENGEYQQLNKNVLQIENEYYSPVRPKRVTQSGEKPTDALERGGIQYIELRALDIDPFAAAGISEEQVRFLDLFITWCAITDSPKIECEDEAELGDNLQQVILYGRKPELSLNKQGVKVSLKTWASDIIKSLGELARLFDNETGTNLYQQALAAQQAKVDDSDLTPSAKILNYLLEHNLDNGAFGLELAKQYRQASFERDFYQFGEQALNEESQASIKRQQSVEQNDKVDFTAFLNQYFSS